jgi:hypothetical protein
VCLHDQRHFCVLVNKLRKHKEGRRGFRVLKEIERGKLQQLPIDKEKPEME